MKILRSISMFMLLLCGISHSVASNKKYVIELNTLDDGKILHNYMDTGYNRNEAIGQLFTDVDLIDLLINKYLADFEQHGIDIKVMVNKYSSVRNEDIYKSCEQKDGKIIQEDAMDGFERYMDKWPIEKNVDVTVYWTGFRTYSADYGTETSGMSENSTRICDGKRSLIIVPFRGTQSTVLDTTRGLLHLLGVQNDDLTPCNGTGHVMSYENHLHKNRWSFSSCTVNSLKKKLQELDLANKNCLTDTKRLSNARPVVQAYMLIERDILNPEVMCQRQLQSKDAYFCRDQTFYNNSYPSGDAICKYIGCARKDSRECQYVLPTEEMPCGGSDKTPVSRCSKGRCLPSTHEESQVYKTRCLFGDSRSGKFFDNCDEALNATTPYVCLIQEVYEQCCKTCDKMYSGETGQDGFWTKSRKFDSVGKDLREKIIKDHKLLGKHTVSKSYNSSCEVSRYALSITKGQDSDEITLFDHNVNLAGMQYAMPTNYTTGNPSQYDRPPFIKDNGKYYLTAYFKSIDNICKGGRTNDELYRKGIGFLIQIGPDAKTDSMSVPINETDLLGTKWVKGKCVETRGTYYFYNVGFTNDMDCKKFFPWYLLYNKGKLTGFGWVMFKTLTSTSSDRFSKFMESPPNCVKQLDYYTRQLYLNKHPENTKC